MKMAGGALKMEWLISISMESLRMKTAGGIWKVEELISTTPAMAGLGIPIV